MIIPNQSNVSFSYILPDGSTERKELDSNIVNTEILTYSVPKVKTADKQVIQEGETSVHTVTITNNSATQLFNNFFKDQMTSGASYVAGSVVVNGVSQPTYDPIAGFALPALNPGQAITISYTIIANDPLTITSVTDNGNFSYSVNDPVRNTVDFNENTNEVNVIIVSNAMKIVKSVDKTFAIKGEIIHYSSEIMNAGTGEKTDIFFKDPIPAGTTFVAGSVTINGSSFPAYNPQTGFDLPDMAPGETFLVEFDVKVD